VKHVKSYKYLGCLISSGLKWNDHVEYAAARAKCISGRVSRFLSMRGVSLSAKRTIFNAKVRSGLEYGVEMMAYNNQSLVDKRETVQNQAGIRILSLNSKTKREAVIRLLRNHSLDTRRKMAMLRFYSKLCTMDEARIVHRVFAAIPPPTKGSAMAHVQKPWRTVVDQLIQGDPGLAEAAVELESSIDEVRDCRPLQDDRTWTEFLADPVDPVVEVDDMLPDIDQPELDAELKHAVSRLAEARAAWDRAITRWAASKEHEMLQGTIQGVRSTTRILNRVYDSAESISATSRAATGAALRNNPGDKIRVRLLGGMSALKTTLGRVHEESRDCHCEAATEETVPHFLLDCKLYQEQRAAARAEVEGSCTCTGVRCSAFFDALDREGKCSFVLGGPVGARAIEPEVDEVYRRFVAEAWATRSRALTEEGEVDVVEDDDSSPPHSPRRESGQPLMTDFFSSNQGQPGEGGSGDEGESSPPTQVVQTMLSEEDDRADREIHSSSPSSSGLRSRQRLGADIIDRSDEEARGEGSGNGEEFSPPPRGPRRKKRRVLVAGEDSLHMHNTRSSHTSHIHTSHIHTPPPSLPAPGVVSSLPDPGVVSSLPDPGVVSRLRTKRPRSSSLPEDDSTETERFASRTRLQIRSSSPHSEELGEMDAYGLPALRDH
jgi:hypothetical protein